jgi:hypothetical protein
MGLLASLRRIVSPPVAIAAEVAEPAVDKRVRPKGPPPPKGRAGSAGTRWSAQRPNIETAPELRGRAWPETARKMMRGDPKLAGVMRMMINALLSARYRVEAGDASAEAERNAEYLRAAFGLEGRPSRLGCDPRRNSAAPSTFEGEIEKALWYLPIGYRVLEEVYYVGPDGYVWLDQLADTEPESIQEWVRDPETGELVGVKQERVSGALPSETREIPADKCIILTHGRTGDNYEGAGLLRPCWFAWKLKAHILDQLAVGAERWANPVPKVTGDRKALAESGVLGDEIADLMSEGAAWAEEYISDERSFVMAPAGIEIGTFGEGAYDPSGLLSVVSHLNQEMLTAALAHFMELGLGDVGSRATGQVHWNSFRQSIVQTLDYICASLMPLIRRLLGFNFSAAGTPIPPSKMPTLVHYGLDVDGLSDALGSIASLISAGALTPTDAVETRILRLMGMGPGPAREWSDRLGRAVLTTPQASDGGRPQDGPRDSQ